MGIDGISGDEDDKYRAPFICLYFRLKFLNHGVINARCNCRGKWMAFRSPFSHTKDLIGLDAAEKRPPRRRPPPRAAAAPLRSAPDAWQYRGGRGALA